VKGKRLETSELSKDLCDGRSPESGRSARVVHAVQEVGIVAGGLGLAAGGGALLAAGVGAGLGLVTAATGISVIAGGVSAGAGLVQTNSDCNSAVASQECAGSALNTAAGAVLICPGVGSLGEVEYGAGLAQYGAGYLPMSERIRLTQR